MTTCLTNEVKTGHDDSEISWGIKDGDYEYLGLVVGSGGGIIEFGTLSGRQPSSSPNVGQVSDYVFTPNN